MVVAAHVRGLALDRDQAGVDLGRLPAEGLRHRREPRLELLVPVLGGQGLGPVEGQVEVAAAVVDLADLAGRRLAVVQEFADGRVEGLGQDLGLSVLEGPGQVLERGRESGELAQRIPAQVVLLFELG